MSKYENKLDIMNNLPNIQPSSRRTFLRQMTALGMTLPVASCTVALGRDEKTQPAKY
jgi:hypothetical protein